MLKNKVPGNSSTLVLLLVFNISESRKLSILKVSYCFDNFHFV
jgi:hypothetical protein